MPDQTAQHALDVPMIEHQGAGAKEPCPRELVTLALVAACLTFWTIVILVMNQTG